MEAVAVIADAHLGGPGGSAVPLVAQLDELDRARCSRLVFLGDLFQAWIGSRRFESEEIRSVVRAIGRLRDRGVRVDYIEGNRDFFIAKSEYASSFDSVGFELEFLAGGVRFLVVHGDGLNAKDYQYRFWRRLSKNPLSRLGMTSLPGPVARYLVDRMEQGLSKTNFKHKKEIPREVLEEYGRKRLSEGHDVLLLGHFHEPRSWQVTGGEVRILDAWFRSHAVEWLVGGPGADRSGP